MSTGDLSLSGQNLYVNVTGGNVGLGNYVRITSLGNAPTNNHLITGICVNSGPRGAMSVTILTQNGGTLSPFAVTKLS